MEFTKGQTVTLNATRGSKDVTKKFEYVTCLAKNTYLFKSKRKGQPSKFYTLSANGVVTVDAGTTVKTVYKNAWLEG